MTFRDDQFTANEIVSNFEQNQCKDKNVDLAEDLNLSKNRKLETAIFEFLQSQRGPVTEKQLFESIKGRRQNKLIALRTLLAVTRPRVERLGSGEKGDPYLYVFQDVGVKSPAPDLNEGASRSVFKRYKLPDGSMLELSKGEFEALVDLTKQLHNQAGKVHFFESEIQKENEPLEPIKNGDSKGTLVMGVGK